MNYQPPSTDETALLTDHYELTMLQASLRSGAADRRAIFEVFARHLPHGRRYGVVAGTGRLLDAIERFRFSPADLEFLGGAGIVDSPTLAFLQSYRFGGNIWGYAEGDCYFPGSPILVVEGTFAEAVLLETVTLSILNHDCAIASAASRMVTAAGDRPLIEMGSRRTHERAAVASARAAYIAGFASTSNLRARQEYGVPSAGTSAHAFTLVHDSERHAFETQLESLGPAPRCWWTPTTCRGRSALPSRWRAPTWARCGSTAATCRCWPARSARCSTSWARPAPGSSSPATWTSTPSRRWARSRSTATGWAPRWSPVRARRRRRWCTSWWPGPPRPPRTRELEPVAKRSVGKPGRGGRKWAVRHRDEHGTALSERVSLIPPEPGPLDRELLVPLVAGGEVIGHAGVEVPRVEAARARHRESLAELPPYALQLSRGYPAIPTVFDPDGAES